MELDRAVKAPVRAGEWVVAVVQAVVRVPAEALARAEVVALLWAQAATVFAPVAERPYLISAAHSVTKSNALSVVSR